jgi:hypothetical protein
MRSMRRSRTERRSVLIAVGVVVGVWLILVFANALADASEQSARLAREQAVNDALQARVEAGAGEIATIQQRSFLDFLARGYSMGEREERTFALAAGAPPPPVMTPLGAGMAEPPAASTGGGWLDLFLGG